MIGPVGADLPVLARIADIRARFAAPAPAPAPAPATVAPVTVAPASAGTFDAVLRRAQQAAAPPRPATTGWAPPAGGSGGALGDDTPYAELFRAAGAAHGIDPALLAAVARVESGFDPTARSSAGAEGLMQFMPGTSAGMGVDPWDPASAVDGAARLLRSHLDRFGRLDLALAAYNAGPGNVARHGGIPPFAETRAYVAKVLALVPGAA